jgi:hypothetical protein
MILTKTFPPAVFARTLEAWAWVGLEGETPVLASLFGADFYTRPGTRPDRPGRGPFTNVPRDRGPKRRCGPRVRPVAGGEASEDLCGVFLEDDRPSDW